MHSWDNLPPLRSSAGTFQGCRSTINIRTLSYIHGSQKKNVEIGIIYASQMKEIYPTEHIRIKTHKKQYTYHHFSCNYHPFHPKCYYLVIKQHFSCQKVLPWNNSLDLQLKIEHNRTSNVPVLRARVPRDSQGSQGVARTQGADKASLKHWPAIVPNIQLEHACL